MNDPLSLLRQEKETNFFLSRHLQLELFGLSVNRMKYLLLPQHYKAAPNRATPIARPRRSRFFGIFFPNVFLPKTRGGGGSDSCLQMAAVPVRRNHTNRTKTENRL
jgi:hypothetical protein